MGNIVSRPFGCLELRGRRTALVRPGPRKQNTEGSLTRLGFSNVVHVVCFVFCSLFRAPAAVVSDGAAGVSWKRNCFVLLPCPSALSARVKSEEKEKKKRGRERKGEGVVSMVTRPSCPRCYPVTIDGADATLASVGLAPSSGGPRPGLWGTKAKSVELGGQTSDTRAHTHTREERCPAKKTEDMLKKKGREARMDAKLKSETRKKN